MKKDQAQARYKQSATCFVVFSFIGIAEAIVGYFGSNGLVKFLSGILVAIIMAILAIAQANKVDSPDKEKIKRWGKAGIIISGVLIALFAALMIYVANNYDKVKSFVDSTKDTKEVENNSSKDKKKDDSAVVATIEPEPTYTTDTQVSDDIDSTYKAVYDEYVVKIDDAYDKAVSEYNSKSANMSDDEKYDLADKLSNSIYDVAQEGSDKMMKMASDNPDTEEDPYDESSKLIDYAGEKSSQLYDIVYGTEE